MNAVLFGFLKVSQRKFLARMNLHSVCVESYSVEGLIPCVHILFRPCLRCWLLCDLPVDYVKWIARCCVLQLPTLPPACCQDCELWTLCGLNDVRWSRCSRLLRKFDVCWRRSFEGSGPWRFCSSVSTMKSEVDEDGSVNKWVKKITNVNSKMVTSYLYF